MNLPPPGPSDRPHLPRPVVLLTLGAIALRLLLFLGRGDYVAFDEGWYLLLGRSLWSGDGYTLTGLRHVALSPLFPILAGGAGRLLGDPVWGGRLVAAVSAGLLVLPCWSIARRLWSERVAYVAAVFVTVTPSLAAFVAPYWIGWDLWVGAEPLLHLFLFTGLALFLRAWGGGGWASALGCGAAFALAYLARPEAIGTFTLLGVTAVAVAALGSLRGGVDAPTLRHLMPRAAACALAFVLVSAPYWLFLHSELGRWSLSGRAVQVMPDRVATARPAGGTRGVNRIEEMLWADDPAYVRRLYSLDATGTRLANDYWGIRPPVEAPPPPGVSAQGGDGEEPAAPAEAATAPAASTQAEEQPRPSPALVRYLEALGVAAPWYLWLFFLFGSTSAPRPRRPELEALVSLPVIGTSLLIVRLVAIDPRTQLVLVPWVALYAAAGACAMTDRLSRGLGRHLRPGLPAKLIIGGLVLALLGTSLARLGFSLAVGSPHHTVAAQNAAVGEAIRRASPEDATVVSFHPAVALFAERDWRVLPVEPMERIVRYARRQPTPYLVLSVFYPPPIRPLEEPHYLVVPVRPDLPESGPWHVDVEEPAVVYAFGELMRRE